MAGSAGRGTFPGPKVGEQDGGPAADAPDHEAPGRGLVVPGGQLLKVDQVTGGLKTPLRPSCLLALGSGSARLSPQFPALARAIHSQPGRGRL